MTPGRYRALDHWRGFAALAVAVFHECIPWQQEASSGVMQIVKAVAAHGWLGVQLFFVISGYCVMQRLARPTRRWTWLEFLIDRGARIFPPYWAALGCVILLILIASPFNHHPLWGESGTLSPPDLGTHATYFLLIRIPLYLFQAWSIAHELAFYAIAAAASALLACTGVRWPGLALMFSLGFLRYCGLLSDRFYLFDHLLEFSCGVLAFFSLHAETKTQRMFSIAAIALLAVTGKLLQPAEIALPFAAVYALILVLLYRWDSSLANVRWLRPFAWCGTFSYSLYLLHVAIMSPMSNLLGRLCPPSGSAHFAIALVALGAAVVAAKLFHAMVELPVESWRHRRLQPWLRTRLS